MRWQDMRKERVANREARRNERQNQRRGRRASDKEKVYALMIIAGIFTIPLVILEFMNHHWTVGTMSIAAALISLAASQSRGAVIVVAILYMCCYGPFLSWYHVRQWRAARLALMALDNMFGLVDDDDFSIGIEVVGNPSRIYHVERAAIGIVGFLYILHAGAIIECLIKSISLPNTTSRDIPPATAVEETPNFAPPPPPGTQPMSPPQMTSPQMPQAGPVYYGGYVPYGAAPPNGAVSPNAPYPPMAGYPPPGGPVGGFPQGGPPPYVYAAPPTGGQAFYYAPPAPGAAGPSPISPPLPQAPAAPIPPVEAVNSNRDQSNRGQSNRGQSNRDQSNRGQSNRGQTNSARSGAAAPLRSAV